MGHVVAKVRFEDLDRFLETFRTRGRDKRGEHGSRGGRVFRDVDNPNEAFILFDWDKADAEAFLADPDVPAIMQAAGFEGPPETTFVEEVAQADA